MNPALCYSRGSDIKYLLLSRGSDIKYLLLSRGSDIKYLLLSRGSDIKYLLITLIFPFTCKQHIVGTLFVLILYLPINNFSVMLGHIFLS